MYDLYYFPGNANLAPHLVLEAMGLPYRLVLVDRDCDAQKSDAYRHVNPMGRIPALVADHTTVWESAAICLYLADLQPNTRMAPAPQDPHRGPMLQWLMFMTNTLQPALMAYHYPKGSTEQAIDVARSDAKDTVYALWAIANEHLPASLLWCPTGGLSCLGAYGLMLGWWSRTFVDLWIPLTTLRTFLVKASRDPVVQAVFEQEELALAELIEGD